jgi:hypothetical protein
MNRRDIHWSLKIDVSLDVGAWNLELSNGLHLAWHVVEIVSESEKLGWQRFYEPVCGADTEMALLG